MDKVFDFSMSNSDIRIVACAFTVDEDLFHGAACDSAPVEVLRWDGSETYNFIVVEHCTVMLSRLLANDGCGKCF